ncbi:MAG TPA: LamG-like jellyroll fold domain-containing protein [Geminicoccaceae bacterium]
MSSRAFVSAPVLVAFILALIAATAGPSPGARADQPAFTWQEGRHFDGRSEHVVVAHDPKWLLAGGTLVLDFTADRLKGVQGLLSKDARGFGDGGHLVIWLDEGRLVVRLQDRKNDHLVQSPANAVKKAVPTRLSLAFGPGGMKLFLDGTAVGSNPHAGGLQGNQEPLVIGARDWKSEPRAADNLDAFFAGTVGGLALYDRALDAPAIAALGPAGTALAQAAVPPAGVAQPVTGVAPATSPQPPGGAVTSAPVDLKLPPEVVTRPVQPVIVETGPTITVTPEKLDTGSVADNLALRPQQGVELRGGALGLIKLTRPTEETPVLLMFEDRAKKAAGSEDIDEQRAALFVELVKTAFKPRKSNEDLRALEWWATVMKQKRIDAARGAQQAYADWQRGTAGPRPSRTDVLLGFDKDPPSYEALLASGFERVSGLGTAAANQSWRKALQRLEAARVELQSAAGGDVDAKAIIDGVVTTLSLLKDGFTGWTTVAGTAYSIASSRWEQVQEAEGLPGKLDGFLSFARATTPSLTESLYTEEGAKQAYVALIETTL